MREKVKRMSLLFWMTVAAMFVGSMSLSLIPLMKDDNTVMEYAVGVAFWVFHIAAYVILIFLGRTRKEILASRKSRRRLKAGPGAISFFRTPVGTAFDVLTAISIVLLVVLGILRMDYEWWYYLLISTAILSLQFHGMFNGRNYRNMIQFKKERQHEKV